MSLHDVTVIGAGIGGLTAALALSRIGRRVTLVERRTGFTEVGAGLQLSPNATRILGEFGLGQALARQACEPQRVVVRSVRSGREIGEVAQGAFMRERFGAPNLVIHRADLQTILLDAVRAQPNIRLLMGRTLEHLDQHDGHVALAFGRSGERREETASALVIGADGGWSKTRPLIGDTRVPAYQGYVAWRATIARKDAPAELAGEETGLWLGPQGHIVHYPVSAGRKLNIVAIRRQPKAAVGWSEPGERAELLGAFSAAAPPLKHLLATPAEWLLWSLHDLPAGQMARERVALLGDAAHPVLPFMAQGAAMAIEDAHILMRALHETPAQPVEALKRYAKLRIQRVRHIQETARRNGRIYHAGLLTSLGRNLVMRRLGPEGMAERYAWIYAWAP
ncbi:MAG: FAD-dependent monooxygenase [Salinarimonas sp.]|nr:FAD-dependent monooxygenase [Salinarimonas sp.]